MTTQKMPRFIDMQHAAGMVWCLEDHMTRIAQTLDHRLIAKFDPQTGERLTLNQRVFFALFKHIIPEPEPTDPEDIIDLLYEKGWIAQTFEEEMQLKIVEANQAKDGAYSERNALVCLLSKVFPSVLGRHPMDEEWEDDWRNIVFINLPTGQASWHIHDSELSNFRHLYMSTTKWDGHTTEEKYKRVYAVEQWLSPDSSESHPEQSPGPSETVTGEAI